MVERNAPPEQVYRLSPAQSWVALFEQDIPEVQKQLSARSIADYFASTLSNIHLVFAIPGAHDKWRGFKSTNIAVENTTSISFTPGTNPYGMLSEALFRDPLFHTESIQILDAKMVKELEIKLKAKRILRENGSLAGEILFAYNKRRTTDPNIAVIGLGVINIDTNEPEGIIFVPDGMFPYNKRESSGGNGRKRSASPNVTRRALEPVSVTI